MAPSSQPPERSNSRPPDETQEREPAQPRRTASANDLFHNNPPLTIRLADDPGSGHMLVNRERLSDNVRGSAGLGSRTETPPQSSEQRLEDARMLLQYFAVHEPVQEATQAQTYSQQQMNQIMLMRQPHQRDILAQERTRTLQPNLQPRRPPAFGQDAPLNPTQQLSQPGQLRSYMPSLRSQPEFYMTGVTAVNTTAETIADNTECTICLEPLSDDVVKFQACGHMFHTVCVQSWFDQSAPRTGHKRGTCPNCRHELYEPDPRYGRAVPPQNVEQPVVTHGQWYPIPASSGREPFGRREEVTTTIQPSRGDRHSESIADFQRRLVEGERQERAERAVEAVQREAVTSDNRRREFVANFQRRLAEHEQNTGTGRQAPAVTPQRQGTTRRVLRGEPIRGDRRPRADALERARDDPPAQDGAVSLPPRTSSLPNGGAIRRQQASQIMTDALRITASSRDLHFGDERVNPDASDHVPNVGESSRTPSTPLEGYRSPTPIVDRQPVQPRESRATLAARAIAQRRPLVLEPGLNNRDTDPTQTVRRPASSSQHSAANGNRDSIRVPGFQRHRQVPQPDLTLTERAIRDLQHEQNVLLDRLREVQNQLGRHLQAADTTRERRTVVLRSTPNYLARETQDDSSTGRPPPIAIPRLADPAFPNLRSAREFPDRRAIGSGTSIWSADYGTPSERNTGTQAPGQRVSLLSQHIDNRPTADLPAGVTNGDGQILSSPVSTYPATSSGEQPTSADNPVSIAGTRQLLQGTVEDLSREQEDLERLILNGEPSEQSFGPGHTDDEALETLQ